MNQKQRKPRPQKVNEDFQSNYRSEIDMWAAMWDEMEQGAHHPAPEKPKPSAWASEILGDKPQDTYYDYMDSDPELFHEAESKVQNPIYPDSVGDDQDGPAPVWVSEELLKEVETLKKKLFRVENQMARMGQGKKWTAKPIQENGKALMSEIQKIRVSLERVSSQLGIQNEPSPYRVKKS